MVEPEQSPGARPARLRSPAARRPASRSGRRSTPSCSSSSASTARRSSSSTTAAAPSASRCASTSWPRRRSRAPTTARWRARSARSSRRCSRPASCRAWSPPRRSSSASTWAPSTSCCRSSRRSRSPAGCSASAAPATTSATRARAASSRSSAPTCSSARSSSSSCARAASSRPSCRATRSTSSPSRSSRSRRRAEPEPVGVDELYALVTRTHSYAELSRDAARERPRHARRPLPVAGVRRAAPAHRVGPRRRDDPRAQGRAPARGHQRRHDPRPRPVLRRAARRPPRRRARRGDGLRGARRARRSCSARRRGASRRSAATASSSRPRPACPGAVPFWKGDSVGRPKELGRGDRRVQPLGRRPAAPRCSSATTTSTRSPPRNLARLPARAAGGHARRARATARSSSSASATRSATGACASSARTAGASTPPGALALSAPHPRRVRPRVRRDLVRRRDHRPPPRRRRAAGRRARAASSPTSSRTPSSPSSASSALFGARFRENAAPRAAHPARLPGQAHAAVAAAPEVAVAARGRQALRRLPDHPRDLPRVPARRARPARAAPSCCAALHRRELSLVEVETPTASPFASSLLFDYVATYMYEGDTPNAERRAAALSLDRDLLRELLGQEELRELIDPARSSRSRPTSSTAPTARARDTRDALADVLRRARRPDRRRGRATACSPASTPAAMLADARARAPRGPPARRRRGALDRRRRRRPVPRRASAPCRPAGCPRRSSADVDDALEKLVAPLRAHARPVHHRASCATATASTRPARCARSSAPASSCAASCAPAAASASGATPRSCAACAAPRSPCCARRSRPPTSARSPPSCRLAGRRPPSGGAAPGVDRLREVLVPLQGLALPADVWERDVLPRRVGAYSPTWLDQLCASGEVVWVGAGALGPQLGPRRALLPRRRRGASGRRPYKARAARRRARARAAARAPRRRRRASSPTCSPSSPLAPEQIQEALWDLVWAGEVTNDALAPLRAPRLTLARAQRARDRDARPAAASARAAAAPQAQVQGRWSLTTPIFRAEPEPGAAPPHAGRAAARALRHRHPRAGARRGHPRRLLDPLRRARRSSRRSASAAAATSSRASAARSSRCPGAVERLRAQRADEETPPIVLAATDPAQPYGAALPWPKRDDETRAARSASPAPTSSSPAPSPSLYVERGGKGIAMLVDADDPRLAPGARGARRASSPRGRGRKLVARARRRRAGRRLALGGAARRARLPRRAAQAHAERMIARIDHVQVAAPAGGEGAARAFYGDLLGLPELPKPERLRARGGVWFAVGDQQLHVGIEESFAPARKAHPALAVPRAGDLSALAAQASRPPGARSPGTARASTSRTRSATASSCSRRTPSCACARCATTSAPGRRAVVERQLGRRRHRRRARAPPGRAARARRRGRRRARRPGHLRSSTAPSASS